jgi:hypothetical protein
MGSLVGCAWRREMSTIHFFMDFDKAFDTNAQHARVLDALAFAPCHTSTRLGRLVATVRSQSSSDVMAWLQAQCACISISGPSISFGDQPAVASVVSAGIDMTSA